MTTQRKVYITNFCGLDYMQAEKYGNLKSITSGKIEIKDIGDFSRKVSPIIMQATPDDFLLLSGNVLACVIITSIWIRVHGIVNILAYSKPKDDYVPYNMTDTGLYTLNPVGVENDSTHS